MDITLPTIPAGVLVLLALLAPYLQAIIQRPSWSPNMKKVLAVVLAVVVAQASYTLVTKTTATVVERSLNADVSLRRDLR